MLADFLSNPLKTILLLLLSLVCSETSQANAGIRTQINSSDVRVKATALGLIYQISDASLYAVGPEVGVEKIFKERWSIGGGLGQAYAYDQGIKTIATSIDVGLWYSVFGSFMNIKQTWSEADVVMATYSQTRRGGFRLGLGTQQLFFNNASGAIPFSGLSGKLMYEFGFDIGVDFAAMIDLSVLSNQNFNMNCMRAGVSSIVSL